MPVSRNRCIFLNVGLGEAAKRDVGTGDNQIPDMGAFASGSGWFQVNEYTHSKQWPGKAAIGRLKGEELAQYNLWLDYLDALELVDTSSAPDIEWPTPPAVQAR